MPRTATINPPSRKKRRFTVEDAASKFGKTTARIRQICCGRERQIVRGRVKLIQVRPEIGTLVGGRIRLLSRCDMEKIAKIIDKNGHSVKSVKN